MPSLGADMTSGTVVEWLVKPGDEVRRGQIVAVVDTDKAAIEVEAYEEGVVTDLVVPVGQTVAVGTVLARLAPLGGDTSGEPARPPAPAVPDVTPVATAPPPGPAGAAKTTGPLVRRLAHQLHVELDDLRGTGPDGAIQRSDVTAAAAVAPAGQSGWIRASPLARRRARELGIQLDRVTGSGPRGAIRVADVEQASAWSPGAATPATSAAPVRPAAPPAASSAEPTRGVGHRSAAGGGG